MTLATEAGIVDRAIVSNAGVTLIGGAEIPDWTAKASLGRQRLCDRCELDQN
jgi:hypothetical protein